MKPLSEIPNQEGFVFVGIRHDGSRVECAVYKTGHISGNAVRYFEYDSGRHAYELVGWEHDGPVQSPRCAIGEGNP